MSGEKDDGLEFDFGNVGKWEEPPWPGVEGPPSVVLAYVSTFEHVDDPEHIIPVAFLPACLLKAMPFPPMVARAALRRAGWEGDGELGGLYLPPFVLPTRPMGCTHGLGAYHVKQLNNGTSFIVTALPARLVDEDAWRCDFAVRVHFGGGAGKASELADAVDKAGKAAVAVIRGDILCGDPEVVNH
jgi:hypothetical protein